MKIALIFPPTCDPTAPYISLPLLAACLRAAGHEVLLIDANVEAYDQLLRPSVLGDLRARIERRLEQLEGRPSLTHQEQLLYSALWSARGDADAAPRAIESALETLRDRTGERFYDPLQYHAAVMTVERALRLISAAYHPLELSFIGYRTPFSLLDLAAVEADAHAERNPFHDYFRGALCERLRGASVDLAGISIAFPGQLQPAYALASTIRRALPGLPLVAGGPAISQLLVALEEESRERALGPFHAAVLFEGEDALVAMARDLAGGTSPLGIIQGKQGRDLADLPAPQFDGLPLELYLSPELVLPYDLSRGCYWGRCAFCHYGLTARGTACYRDRPTPAARAHLAQLASQHGCRLFFLSQDSVAPRTILAFARAVEESGDTFRWSTDLRPERFFDADRCRALAQGGALSVSLGVESASPRLLRLIDKGISVKDMRRVIRNLAAAGVAAEVMCLTDFPTETFAEARATLGLLEDLQASISLFICGEFALTSGSRVAALPRDFGLREVWRVHGDELGTGLFYEEIRPAKGEEERITIDEALGALSGRWRLRNYPWAGSLSTAHTMLWYARFGPEVFKDLAARGADRTPRASWQTAAARFDVTRVDRESAAREEEIWSSLIYERRQVSAAEYRALAAASPRAFPSPRRWRYAAGCTPEPLPRRRR